MQVEDAIRGGKTTEEILLLSSKTGIRICEFSFLGDNFGLQMSKDPKIKKQRSSITLITFKSANKLVQLLRSALNTNRSTRFLCLRLNEKYLQILKRSIQAFLNWQLKMRLKMVSPL